MNAVIAAVLRAYLYERLKKIPKLIKNRNNHVSTGVSGLSALTIRNECYRLDIWKGFVIKKERGGVNKVEMEK